MKTGIINTCKEILELKDNFVLDMCTYHCGTSYCIAGRLAYLDNYPERFYNEDRDFKYLEYSLFKLEDRDWEFHSGNDNPIWSFLFDEYWPNSLEHAKRRAQCIIDNKGQVPEWFCIQGNYDFDWRLLNDSKKN